MNCKDCLHYDICLLYEDNFIEDAKKNGFCGKFKDKSDYAKIIHCKDCKHCFINKFGEESGIGVCTNRGIINTAVQLDDFCNYGERRESNDL